MHHVIIIGGGFGGMYAAQRLRKADLSITLIDKRNFHLFQPLLYQVASGGLSPGDIASPLRSVFKRQKNLKVLLSEVTDFDPESRNIETADGRMSYDTLIVAAGAGNSYFGHDEWAEYAPGLKTIEDAVAIRGKILNAFERAEIENDEDRRRSLMTFVVVGGGPTGVEMAGAIAEIATETLRDEFRSIRSDDARVVLIEGAPHVLTGFSESLQKAAENSLKKLGVEVIVGSYASAVDVNGVTYKKGEKLSRLESATVLWAAGVRANPLGEKLASACGVKTDKAGRVETAPNLTIPGYGDLFVIGDMASFKHQTGQPLPGIAPVAMSQGKYVADLIKRRLSAKEELPYKYFDKGILATIGRAAAVAEFFGGRIKISGLLAWIVWLFVHLLYLVEFDNRLLVLTQWAYNYITRNRGARIITNKSD